MSPPAFFRDSLTDCIIGEASGEVEIENLVFFVLTPYGPGPLVADLLLAE